MFITEGIRMASWTPATIGNQAGRVALITGGNSGIGWQTARVLAGHGARVRLAGRDSSRLQAAAAKIQAEVPAAKVDTLVLHLGNLKSIGAAAARVVDAGPLDLLFNNAGVMNIAERQITVDGFEMTFGTNHLGHFAFTAQVMSALRSAPAARVVTVSAIAARWR